MSNAVNLLDEIVNYIRRIFDDGDMGLIIVMVKEHFFLHQMGPNGGHHLSGRRNSLRFHPSRVARFRLSLGLFSVSVDPYFVDRLNNVQHCYEVVSRLRLLSGMSKRDSQHTDSFLMPNISCRMWQTRSFEMHAESAISFNT